jgi:peptide deformylase
MSSKLEFSLVRYPDPSLRRVAKPVTAFDAALLQTVQAMFDLMYASGGVGLAAPQAGLDLRLLVLDPDGPPGDRSQALALVNPQILERSGPSTGYEEGCLSFPEIYAEVKRPQRCRVKAFDLDGTPFEREFDDFPSRIVQHEYDHLEGVLLVDRMSPADRLKHKAALQHLTDRFRRAQGAAR